MPKPTKPAAAPKTFTEVAAYLAASRHGILQPELQFAFPARTHYRVEHAVLLEAAALIERATPDFERWVVNINRDHNAVYLELGEGDQAEAKRGMALLEGIAAKLRG